MLNKSILETIKQMLGITREAEEFDNELVTHINSTFMPLSQLGVCDEDFCITGYNEVWSDFSDKPSLVETAKAFIALKVRMVFDPPASTVVSDAINARLSELEWRLNIQAEKIAQLAESEDATP